MGKPHITSAAEWDFSEALCWYSERSQRAAEGFETEFDRALEMIAADPRRFPYCDKRHRFYLMDRYPYQIIYREEHNEVLVIAIAHAKRKPGYWEGR
jgi:plasmid stabilization system protein ParE